MASLPLADVSALARRIGRQLTSDEILRAEAAIADASALVRAEAGLSWLDDEGALEAVPDLAVSITLAVAQRRFENPQGFVSETQGPFSYRLAGGDSVAGMFLTDAERRLIRGLGRQGGRGLYSVPLTPAYVTPTDPDDPWYMSLPIA